MSTLVFAAVFRRLLFPFTREIIATAMHNGGFSDSKLTFHSNRTTRRGLVAKPTWAYCFVLTVKFLPSRLLLVRPPEFIAHMRLLAVDLATEDELIRREMKRLNLYCDEKGQP